MNCHGCKWLDRYKVDGNGYCCMVRCSKTQSSRVRRPEMERCELYEAGDWHTRHGIEWVVFYAPDGKELRAYTAKGTFPGERRATKELLAYENGCTVDQIVVRIERRPATRRG